MTPVERGLAIAAGALGALVVSLMTAKDGEDYKHPRIATVTLFALVGVCFWEAREHGPGTWIGLFFAVLVPVNVWLGLCAGIQAWVAWMMRREAAARRARRAARVDGEGAQR